MPLESFFKEIVTTEFSFLVKDYGYSFFQEKPWRLFYQKTPLKIVLEFDGKSFGCWLEREDLSKANNYRAISIEVISKCLGYRVMENMFFRSREDMLLDEAKKNAVLLQTYCLDLIKGDFSKWDLVIECLKKEDKLQEEKEKAEALEYQLENIRQMADSAWKNKDYKELIRHYKSIENSLSKLERKRLEYAEAQIRKTNKTNRL